MGGEANKAAADNKPVGASASPRQNAANDKRAGSSMTTDHGNGGDGGGNDKTPLTRNEQLVLDVLEQADGPMKAYELLAALKDKGVRAPMTVYRALDRLEARGRIHKLDGINAFVLCNHDHPHPIQVFLICTQCSKAEEISEQGVQGVDWTIVNALGSGAGFEPSSTRVEIRGLCVGCAAA